MIYNDGERRMAIINGNVLKEGDSAPNCTVMKIERNRVMIRTAGREQWLTIE
jgi:peroxiredoxin